MSKRGYQAPFQIRSLCKAKRFAANQARIGVIHRLPCCAVECGCQQPMRLEPAFFRPRRSRPTVKWHACGCEQFVDRYFLENVATTMAEGRYRNLGEVQGVLASAIEKLMAPVAKPLAIEARSSLQSLPLTPSLLPAAHKA